MDNEQVVVPPASMPADVYIPIVWVEAEQVFVARGYIYHMKARERGERTRDSETETVLARTAEGVCTVLSSYSHAQLTAMQPRDWVEIEPLYDVSAGERLGDVLVALMHGSNEYTVVNTTANSSYLAQGSR